MNQEMVTFENMPQMLVSMRLMLEALDKKFDRLVRPAEETKRKQWLNVDEVRKYLPSHPRRQTIYSWTSTRRIPFHKKGRSIMFDKDEIDAWLQDCDHMKSDVDLDREAEEFINSKRMNNNKLIK